MSEKTVRECVKFGNFCVEEWQSKVKKTGELKGEPHVRIHSGNPHFSLYLRSVEDVKEFVGLLRHPDFKAFLASHVKGPRVISEAEAKRVKAAEEAAEAAAEMERLHEEIATLKAAAEAAAVKVKVVRRSGGGKAKAEVVADTDADPFI